MHAQYLNVHQTIIMCMINQSKDHHPVSLFISIKALQIKVFNLLLRFLNILLDSLNANFHLIIVS